MAWLVSRTELLRRQIDCNDLVPRVIAFDVAL